MFIKSLIADFFYCLLEFQCTKYSISLMKKGYLKIIFLFLTFCHKTYFPI